MFSLQLPRTPSTPSSATARSLRFPPRLLSWLRVQTESAFRAAGRAPRPVSSSQAAEWRAPRQTVCLCAHTRDLPHPAVPTAPGVRSTPKKAQSLPPAGTHPLGHFAAFGGSLLPLAGPGGRAQLTLHVSCLGHPARPTLHQVPTAHRVPMARRVEGYPPMVRNPRGFPERKKNIHALEARRRGALGATQHGKSCILAVGGAS